MMATDYRSLLRELKAAARQYNATMTCESIGKSCVWQVDAPNGFVWSEGGVHAIKVEWIHGDSAWKADAIQDAISRIGFGLERCFCRDCTGQ